LKLGLTGSIAMGKSEAAGMFRRLGIPVFDADAEVHRLLAPRGRGFEPVSEAFPSAIVDGAIDRQKLGAAVFDDTPALKRLEGILHPLVGHGRARFLLRARALGTPVVVFDIPLLYETGGERRCDLVAVVSAPAFVQRRRALRRPGMTEEKLASILARQVPDREKRRRADFVIPSGLGRRPALLAIRRLLTLLSRRSSKRGVDHA
jgi:dephospho-CoA kinase